MRPGQHRLSPEYVEQVRRERIIRGASGAIARKGHIDAQIGDLVEAGRCGRKALYDNFGDKERCLKAVVEFAGQEALQQVEEAAQIGGTFPARLLAGIEALLDFVGENRDLARVFLINGPAIAPEVLEEVRQRFARILSTQPGIREDLIVGSIESVLYRHAVEKPDDSPQYLVGFLCDLVLDTAVRPASPAAPQAAAIPPAPEPVAA